MKKRRVQYRKLAAAEAAASLGHLRLNFHDGSARPEAGSHTPAEPGAWRGSFLRVQACLMQTMGEPQMVAAIKALMPLNGSLGCISYPSN